MTTETLMTDGQNTQAAGSQQSAASQTEGQTAAGGEQGQQQQQQQATDGQGTQGQQAQGDTKTEGDQGNTGDKSGAPEQYEFKAPEGMSFDDAVIGAFSEVAKELNLPQDAAQKVLDKMVPVMAARQAEQLQVARGEWANLSKADKEFGGDKLEENLALVKKARDQFASPELRAMLDETGLGNHPEVVRFFYRAGKAISGDSFVGGRAPNAGGKSLADRLYSNPNQ